MLALDERFLSALEHWRVKMLQKNFVIGTQQRDLTFYSDSDCVVFKNTIILHHQQFALSPFVDFSNHVDVLLDFNLNLLDILYELIHEG